jgi:hypothetical protein
MRACEPSPIKRQRRAVAGWISATARQAFDFAREYFDSQDKGEAK